MTSFISALDSGFEQALYAIRDPSLVQFLFGFLNLEAWRQSLV